MTAAGFGSLLARLARAQKNLALVNAHEHSDRLLGLALVQYRSDECLDQDLISESWRTQLTAVAERLEDCLRERDELIALQHGCFALLFKGVASPAHLELAAARLERLLKKPLYSVNDRLNQRLNGALVALTARADPQATLRAALSALRQAQQRGSLLIAGAPTEDSGADMADLLIELELALTEGELVPFFQPKVHGSFHSLVGVEALVRWLSPSRGMVAPGMFIPALEDSALAEPFTHRFVRSVLGCMQRWPASLGAAINVPAGLLASGNLQLAFEDGLALFGIAPERLTVEITEASFVSDMLVSAHALQSLQALGLKISIDDFGTGYSSLAYLRDLPADELKLDRSFIRNLCSDPKDRALVGSVINLAHDLGLSVVGEGVEDSATAKALKALGCDTLQGYLFAKPMPQSELLQWIEQRGG